MNIEEFRAYCLSKPNVTESFPFDEVTLVMKVGGKMFTAANIEGFVSFNVKCDPEEAQLLREAFEAVQPGYHMNKKHWNTVFVNEDASLKHLYKWLDDSYELVKNSLSKKVIQSLEWEE